MNRNRGRAAVRMPKPPARPALANFLETKRRENGRSLHAASKNRNRGHPVSGHDDDLRADELARHCGRAVVEDHRGMTST